MIQTSTPNAMKCLISFPNVAILTTSKALNRVQNVNRESILEPSASNKEELPKTWSSEILKFYNQIQKPPIFPNPPLVSFKRDRNLRNSLVRSSLHPNLHVHVELGTFNFSRKRCNTCPFINSKTHVKGPKRFMPSKWPFRLHNLKCHLLHHLHSAANSTLENLAVNWLTAFANIYLM